MDTHPAGTSLTLTRRIPAPPEAVFAAWIEPEKVKAWFGPYGMTCPTAEIEPRAGGRHFTVMRDAAGTAYPNPQIIDEIVPNRRLVLRVPAEGSSCPGRSARSTSCRTRPARALPCAGTTRRAGLTPAADVLPSRHRAAPPRCARDRCRRC